MASSVLIDELWIIKPDGTTILNERKDLTIDEQLFGGLLVAINSFLIEIGLEQCQTIITENAKLTILYSTSPSLIFIARSSPIASEKDMNAKLHAIRSTFMTHFKNWAKDQYIIDKKTKALFISLL
ncbi:hypothetical protein DSAG12_00632 [Promethearchaeum syntrophicum]|uniref:FUZ/MON1/HPS1 first Longin domain-containing protein n=1 Tax=Promethearchaeum syntrophicum TaxID=2594042 RepID=A0A5B9D733_9ARCH|nr:hypothetical protein [Candidatus Prometheoarchaeum syntrophicum]QEE14815.1 hypothetical protein DSAG12_00632 [Candidatus Prometheoarchaeum syntrophicum]